VTATPRTSERVRRGAGFAICIVLCGRPGVAVEAT
jgi:hypothetical protein